MKVITLTFMWFILLTERGMCEIIVKYISASRVGFLGNSFQLLRAICVRPAACSSENAVVRYSCIFNGHIRCSAFITFKSAFTPCFSLINNLYKKEEMLKSVWQDKCNLIHRLRSDTDSISSCGTSALCRSRIMRPGFAKVIRVILYGNGSELSEMSLCEATARQKLSHFARAELGNLWMCPLAFAEAALASCSFHSTLGRSGYSVKSLKTLLVCVLGCRLSYWMKMLLLCVGLKWIRLIFLVLNADWSVQWSSCVIFHDSTALTCAHRPWWIVIFCCIATCCHVRDCF